MKNAFLKTKEEIETWLISKKIENFSIVSDDKFGWAVNVDGRVHLFGRLEKCYLPVKFKRIEGDFYIGGNYLTSLIGSPDYVKGIFNCKENNLTSLKYSPGFVGQEFNCNVNKLKSLKGCSQNDMEHFSCCNNELNSLKYAPKKIAKEFACDDNNLTSLEHCPSHVRTFHCSHNLIDTLEFLPEKCTENIFSCEGNKGLEAIIGRKTFDFNFIQNVSKSIIEKKQLELSLKELAGHTFFNKV